MSSISNARRLRLHGSRDGVTLLEVLVAMGVMVVGLLGMLALIPLGRMELVEAEKMDNSSTIGRWAFRDVTVRGYLQPENWIDPVTRRPIFGGAAEPPVPYALVKGAKTREFVVSGALTPPVAPIVIDPLMLTPRKFATQGEDDTQRASCKFFPYSLSLPGSATGMPEAMGNVPKIARVSLRAYPPDVISTVPQNLMMQADIASRFMRSNDDLNFQVPSDTSRRPIQVYSRNSSSTMTFFTNDGYGNELKELTNVASRGYRGAYSWFLVAEPSLAEFYSPIAANAPAMGGPAASAATIRQYRVWVIVCHQRQLNSVAGLTLADAKGIGERMVFVDFLDRNTARLRVGGMKSDGDAAVALDVKANQWIAVVGRYSEPLVAGGTRFVMEWYRITGVSESPTLLQDDVWYREVTLVGREFAGLGFSFDDESKLTYPDINTGLTGKSNPVEPMTGIGILVSGVRGVFEKSIYVDRPSMYSIRY